MAYGWHNHILITPVGSGSNVENTLGPVRQYCAEGVAEAEAAGDTEMYAEFLMQAALLNLIDGRPITDTQQILEVSNYVCYLVGFDAKLWKVVASGAICTSKACGGLSQVATGTRANY